MTVINFFKIDNKLTEGTKHVFNIILVNTDASFNDIDGFNYEGDIVSVKMINGFSLDKLKFGDKIVAGKRINIFDIKFLKLNGLAFYSNINKEYKNLLNSLFNNITFTTDTEQQHVIFFNCKKSTTQLQQSSEYYKIHISIDIKTIFATIVNLSKILCKYTDLFNQAKIILPFFSHYYDITDPMALKYLKWNGGSSVANIVLYPLKKYDDNPLLFQSRLIDFSLEWITKNDKFGRDTNNLYFNERLTKSLYLAYGSDSSSKITEIQNGVIKNYKMSNNLKKEQKKLCTKENISKFKLLNDCLLNKYNISYLELCSSELSAKNAWVRKNMPTENEIIFGNECYKNYK